MARKDANSKSAAKGEPSAMGRWIDSIRQAVGRAVRRSIVWVVALLVLVGGVAFGFRAVERKVLAHAAEANPVEVSIHLVPTTPWTSDASVQIPERLVQRIEAALMPPKLGFYDAALVDEVHRLATVNEWVRKVHRVHRLPVDADGRTVIRVECDLRSPVAAVLTTAGNGTGTAAAFVDEFGVRLSAGDVPMWQAEEVVDGQRVRHMYIQQQDIPDGRQGRKLAYVGIFGVAGPAPQPGAAWTGEDMRDALRVLALLHSTRYGLAELSQVDVSNYRGRDPNRPEISLVVKREKTHATEIRFGRFPHPRADWVIRPERKMAYLDDYVRKIGRGTLSGTHEWIDVQYDQCRVGPPCGQPRPPLP